MEGSTEVQCIILHREERGRGGGRLLWKEIKELSEDRGVAGKRKGDAEAGLCAAVCKKRERGHVFGGGERNGSYPRK